MRLKSVSVFTVIAFILSCTNSFALIKIDDNSIDLAVKYGIEMNNMSKNYVFDANWVNDKQGRILNIYSPFIQIVSKTMDQSITGNMENDLKNVRKKINRDIQKIKDKNEVRFIISFCGDTVDFAKNYNGFLVKKEEYLYNSNNYTKIKPKKTDVQKKAEKDNFYPDHPFSAVNCYTFSFEDLEKLNEYYFILVSEAGEEINYLIDNEKIF